MNIAWGRGFFRIWVLLSVVWIGGAIWIESNPPVQSGPPPPFDETLPYLKTVRGVKMDKLSDCEPAASKTRASIFKTALSIFATSNRKRCGGT